MNFNIDTENLVIGTIINTPDVLNELIEHLNADLFYDKKNQLIIEAVLNLYNSKQEVNLSSICIYFHTKNIQGKPSQLDISKKANNYKYGTLAKELYFLKDLFIKRTLKNKAMQLQSMCEDISIDPFDLIAFQEKSINSILSQVIIKDNLANTQDLHNDLINHVLKIRESKTIGIDTGFECLNKGLGGWQNGDLIILAARPGMGKTSLATNFAMSAAKTNNAVLFFSIEMPKLQLFARLASQENGIELTKYLRTGMSQDELLYFNSNSQLNKIPIYIDDSGGIDINYILMNARKAFREKKIKIIFIDFLQRIRLNDKRSTNDSVGEVTRQLKDLAKELNIPIILLSQLSRDVEKRGGDKRPILSDLRDSGNIEQDADIVMFPYRAEYYAIKEIEDDNGYMVSSEGKAELIIAKHRNGGLGAPIVNFSKTTTNFY